MREKAHYELGFEHGRKGLPRYRWQDRYYQEAYDEGYDAGCNLRLERVPESLLQHFRRTQGQ